MPLHRPFPSVSCGTNCPLESCRGVHIDAHTQTPKMLTEPMIVQLNFYRMCAQRSRRTRLK